MSSLHLRVLVFTSGLTVMAVELTGLRLIAPYFGTSMMVTTILIGSMMGFLSVGYSLGGRYADKKPSLKSLCKVSGAAGAMVIALPFLSQPILRAAAMAVQPMMAGKVTDDAAIGMAMIVGGVFGIIALFSVPVTLMGMVSPWAVRLAVSDVKDAGKAAGQLYALSTFGSIIGSFLPALLLVPLWGVRNTFIMVGASLLAVSLYGIVSPTKAAGISTLSVLFTLLPQSATMPVDGLIYEEESIYHHIQVVNKPFGRCKDANYLFLNEGIGIHSVRCNDNKTPIRGYWGYAVAAAAYAEDPAAIKDVCIIGLAGGTMANQLLQAYPNAQIDGVEIDRRIVEIGKEYFDNADPRISPIVLDGRVFLQATDKRYDFMLVDAYRQPYIPFHLTTIEFWKEAKRHMKEGGVIAINVASVKKVDLTLIRMIYRTMREVFPSVHVVSATDSNDILMATLRPTSKDQAWASIQQAPAGGVLSQVRRSWNRNLRADIDGWEDARLLTDDQAPVELLWDSMIVEFAS